MKRLTCVLLVLSILLTVVSMDIFAAENGKCGDNLTWVLDENGVLTISGTGDMYDWDISPVTPSFLWDMSKASPWHGNSNIKKVIVDEGVTSIGKSAFYGCAQLEQITLPTSLKKIGHFSFCECSKLANIVLPEGLIGCGQNALDDVKEIEVPVSMEYFGVCMAGSDTLIKYHGTEEQFKNISNNTDYTNVIYNYVPEVSDDIEGKEEIRILLNNKFVHCDQKPVLFNGRTLVPMRAIFEALGATVSWDDSTQTATGTKDEKTVSLTIDKNTININGVEKSLDVAAQLINNRTMIPVRAVAEAFDCIVNWNGQKQYVIITPLNQTPYKVEALNNSGEIVGTAQFDSLGQLVSMSAKDDRVFLPFYINISGNSYEYIFNSFNSDYEYAYTYSNGIVAQIDMIEKNKTSIVYKDYQYGEEENMLSYNKIYEKYGSNTVYQYSYDNKKASVTGGSGGSVEFNDMWLVESFDFNESGNYGSFEYNEDGLLTYGGNYMNASYSYDSNQQLIKAAFSTMGSPGAIITYRYIQE